MGKLKIPELPLFETVLPSTGKAISYRPITVKEEAFLLIAKESEKQTDINNAIKEVIKACVDYPFKKLKLIDIEWLFLQIRIRSVSNEVELAYKCTNISESGKICGARYETIIDLEKVEVSGDASVSIPIKFKSGEYVLSLVSPSVDAANSSEMEILYSMIDSILDPDGEILTKNDFSITEFEEFIQTFTNAQMETIKEGISKLASLKYVNHLKCPVCGVENTIEYSSLTDFFG